MQPERYPKQSYLMLKRLDDAGRLNWATKVKNLLYSYGFGYIWISQEVGNSVLFLTMFKQRLRDSAIQKCLQLQHIFAFRLSH